MIVLFSIKKGRINFRSVVSRNQTGARLIAQQTQNRKRGFLLIFSSLHGDVKLIGIGNKNIKLAN